MPQTTFTIKKFFKKNFFNKKITSPNLASTVFESWEETYFSKFDQVALPIFGAITPTIKKRNWLDVITNFLGMPFSFETKQTFLANFLGWDTGKFLLGINILRALFFFPLNLLLIIPRFGLNLLKLVTEFIPNLLKNLTNYWINQLINQIQLRSRHWIIKIFIAMPLIVLFPLHFIFKTVHLIGRATTSPHKSLYVAWEAGKDLAGDSVVGKMISVFFCLISLAITTMAYLIIFPITLKLAITYLPAGIVTVIEAALNFFAPLAKLGSPLAIIVNPIFKIMGIFFANAASNVVLGLAVVVGITAGPTVILLYKVLDKLDEKLKIFSAWYRQPSKISKKSSSKPPSFQFTLENIFNKSQKAKSSVSTSMQPKQQQLKAAQQQQEEQLKVEQRHREEQFKAAQQQLEEQLKAEQQYREKQLKAEQQHREEQLKAEQQHREEQLKAAQQQLEEQLKAAQQQLEEQLKTAQQQLKEKIETKQQQPIEPAETKVEVEKSWHFDPQTPGIGQPMDKEYELLQASEKDIKRVVEFYHQAPVPKYEIDSIEVIYNSTLDSLFSGQLKLLQNRDKNPAFAPQWSQKDEPSNNKEWRQKIHMEFESMAVPYQDSNYPAVKLLPMWHGTKPQILDSLLRTGYAAFGTTDQGFFGNGIYSAREAEYSYRVYGQEGILLFNWVACFSAYPVVHDDMQKFLVPNQEGKFVAVAHDQRYDAHFAPVVPGNPSDAQEVNYYPTKPNQTATYHELVVFQPAQCLPRYVVRLKASLLKPPPDRAPSRWIQGNAAIITSTNTSMNFFPSLNSSNSATSSSTLHEKMRLLI